MKLKKRLLCAALSVAAALCAAVPAFADAPKTVRVAVMNYPNFLELTQEGAATGYAAEYLGAIAEYTGWNYEYVQMPFGEALQAVQSGQVDIVAATQKTPEREGLFDYSEAPMGVNAAMLCIPAGSTAYAYEDYAAFNGMRVGGIKGSAFVELCKADMAQRGVQITVSEYATDAEAHDALTAGEVDALIMGTIRCTEDYTVIARIGSVDMYFACNPHDPAVKAGIDAAQHEIHSEYRYYEMKLDEKYFGAVQDSLQFTKSEQEFVDSLGPLTLGYVARQDPVSYTDAKTGQFSGMTRDILDKISQLSGISFAYVPLPAGHISYDYLRANQIEMIASVEYNQINLSAKGMYLTEPYLNAQKVFVGKSGQTFDKNAHLKVAMATGSNSIQEFLHTKYPNFTIVPYDTVEESFRAVVRGDADIVMQNQYVVTYLLSKPQYETLSAFPVEGLADHLCLSSLLLMDEAGNVNQQLTDPRLTSVLNKAIARLGQDEVSQIIAKYTTGNPYHYTTADMLYQYRLPLSCIAVLLVLCAMLFLVILRDRQNNIKRIEAKNAQLSEAIAHADQASRAKSTFLARMSHEIRTPMNAIIGLTTIASNNVDQPAKVCDALEKIDSSSKVLLNIINDVLDMSAIESEKIKILQQPFDLKEVLTSVTSLYYTQCRQKGVSFELNCSELSQELLIGDPLRLNQILLNFLSNAYKFTNPGGKITFSVSEAEKRGDTLFLHLVVSDSGIGMSEDMQKRLFGQFEQENAATAQRYGGSGLGMSIAKNLVELMHGSVQIESELGKGTTFTIDLPFRIDVQKESKYAKKIENLRALVVDGSEQSRAYTAAVLRRIGVQYETAADSAEALAMLGQACEKGAAYDVCFLEWKMPDMTGAALTRKIRERFDAQTLVIIVSAYDLAEIEENAKAAGVNLVVTKPIFQSTVFDLLLSLSDGRCAQKTAEKTAFDFSGKRVLLAEDNALNSEIAAELLHEVNLTVDHAENGKKAVEMFVNSAPGTYDGILMDIQMPEMDGYEAAQRIRRSAHPQARAIPIWAMTANAFQEDVAAALSAGMTGHIAKPIDTQRLYQTLEEWLHKQP